ncbi:hypothetical protein CR513_18780, partial [Mucuna pruriens]
MGQPMSKSWEGEDEGGSGVDEGGFGVGLAEDRRHESSESSYTGVPISCVLLLHVDIEGGDKLHTSKHFNSSTAALALAMCDTISWLTVTKRHIVDSQASAKELCFLLDVLPDEKPRMISGLGLPEEILEGIDAGIDLFDSTLVANSNFHLLNIPILVHLPLTLGGFALTFSLDKSGNQYNFQKSQIGSDLTKINLRAKVYSCLRLFCNMIYLCCDVELSFLARGSGLGSMIHVDSLKRSVRSVG